MSRFNELLTEKHSVPRWLIIALVFLISLPIIFEWENVKATEQAVLVDRFSKDQITGQPEMEFVSGFVGPVFRWKYDIVTVSNLTEKTEGIYNFRTNDKLSSNVEVSLLWSLKPQSASHFVGKYGYDNLDDIKEGIIDRYLASSVANVGNRQKASFMASNLDSVQTLLEDYLVEKLGQDKIEVDEVLVIGEIGLPDQLKQAIDNKVKSEERSLTLDMQRKEAEVKKGTLTAEAEAYAAASRIRAQAISDSLRIVGKHYTQMMYKRDVVEAWKSGAEVPKVSGEQPFILQLSDL